MRTRTALLTFPSVLWAVALTTTGILASDLYVVPSGSDAHPGTRATPFATLERAREELRILKVKSTGTNGDTTV